MAARMVTRLQDRHNAAAVKLDLDELVRRVTTGTGHFSDLV